ncbi:MAG: class I SAM-dependent methyltransferase [Anaerolineae bacterium]
MVPLTLSLVDFLLSPVAQAALDELAGQDVGEQASLELLTRLRRVWPPEQAAALLDQARLRRKASDKFPHPERLLFTDDALQQASPRAVATYRAQQFAVALHRSPFTDHRSLVADLGCGLGADTIALAEAGLRVLAVERDPVRARIAAANVAALGFAERVRVVCGDWLTLTPTLSQREREPESALPLPLGEGRGEGGPPLPLGEGWGEGRIAAFIDPSRRAGEQRIFRLDAMEPPLSAVLALLDVIPTLAVKTLPGIADEDIPPDAEVEFISERGQMKEALLRFGDLRTGAARRATLLPGPHHLDSNAPLDHSAASEPLAYLYEPDSAVIRATLVQHLATRLGAAQLDPTIAYLTSQQPVDTPFARRWAVLRHGPFHLKTLNRWLRELGAGAVVVKKRGSAIDPDEFRRRLKTTPGGPAVTVFLTRAQGRPWMVVGREGEATDEHG